MAELRDISAPRKSSLVMRYPLVEESDLPTERHLKPISFRHDQIERFERVGQVLLYRVMRMNYGKPPEIDIIPKHKGLIECGLRRITLVRSGDGKFVVMDSPGWTEEQRCSFKKVEKMEGRSVGWRYFVGTNSGNLIKIGSRDRDTSAHLCHVVIPESDHPSEMAIEEGRKFVDDLLKEISQHGKWLFDPKMEFERGKGVGLYLLHNVYLIPLWERGNPS